MPREFFVYTDPTGACVLKIDEEARTQHFEDLLDAITHARSMKGEEPVLLSVYDAAGQLVFSEPI